jgi:hypothetical protein
MVLRLILVGLVAGLGLSLPSRRDLETLHRSAQRWVDAGLKEAAPRPPSDDDASVFVVDEPTPTPTRIPAPAPTAAPAADPDRALVGEADVPADDASPAEAVPPLRVAEAPSPAVVSPPLDDPLLAAPTEPAAEVVETKTAEAMPAEDDVDIVDAEAEIAEVEIAKPEVAKPEVVEAGIVEAELVEAELAEAEMIDPDRDFLAVVDEMAAAFAADPAPSQDREAEATRLAQAATEDETGEECEDLYPGLAFAMNREAEGLNPSPSSPEPPAEPAVEEASPTARLSQAVRLTREAVFAWASLLHGPAVVAISQ